MQAFFLTTREWENIGGTFVENRVKYTVVYKDFRNNHGISDIGIERWTPV